MEIREERPKDAAAISAVVTAAFAGAPHSSGTEAAIIETLRNEGALTLSLIAEDGGVILGHIAFSPVTIGGSDDAWYGLGPVAVEPGRQGSGLGHALILAGLQRLRALGARGCVVLGDPAYYGRFGFRADAALTYPGVPSEYFQSLSFDGAKPTGEVSYHTAFDIA
jgi:putative acetyltransferase